MPDETTETSTPTAAAMPIVHGHIVELVVPPALEARAREVAKRSPGVKVTVDERLVGENWLARSEDGSEVAGVGGPIIDYADADVRAEIEAAHAEALAADADGFTIDADGNMKSLSGAPMKTIEAWATEKQMLPQFLDGDVSRVPPGAGVGMRSVAVNLGSLRGPRTNPNHIRFHRAKAFKAWPESKEVTEAEFDKAVTDAETHVCR